MIFEGNRLLYTPTYPAGTQVGGAGNSHLAGDIPAGKTVQWTPNGYKAYYNKASEQSVWHEWSRTWAGASTTLATTTISAKPGGERI
jgi:hypothetical protein